MRGQIEENLVAADPPIVAVNAHSADPHFAPSERNATPISRGDFVLLDLWAKEQGPDAIYADFTWVGFAGESVPEDHRRIFSIVAQARDAAVDLVQRRVDIRRQRLGNPPIVRIDTARDPTKADRRFARQRRRLPRSCRNGQGACA